MNLLVLLGILLIIYAIWPVTWLLVAIGAVAVAAGLFMKLVL